MAVNRRTMVELVMNAQQKNKLMTKEVNRVITMANHRLDRISRTKDIVSPAVDSLEGQRFSIKGFTWEQQKEEYMRAIVFMNDPTSTLGGARAFTDEGVQLMFNVSKKATSKSQWGKYMSYYNGLYKKYGADLMRGEASPDLSYLDSDQIGQFFYDMRLEQSANAIETGTAKLMLEQEQREREQAEKVAENTILGLEELGLKL